jgi:hypothetical protein
MIDGLVIHTCGKDTLERAATTAGIERNCNIMYTYSPA